MCFNQICADMQSLEWPPRRADIIRFVRTCKASSGRGGVKIWLADCIADGSSWCIDGLWMDARGAVDPGGARGGRKQLETIHAHKSRFFMSFVTTCKVLSGCGNVWVRFADGFSFCSGGLQMGPRGAAVACGWVLFVLRCSRAWWCLRSQEAA